MKTSLRVIGLLLVLCTAVSAAVFDWEEKPKGDRVFALKLFVPDDVPKLRAVVVLVPGLDGDGRRMADDPAWQAFAAKNRCAILACSMKGSAGGSYYEAGNWSGKALLDGLKDLAKLSHHPELADAPLALWGHSAGGQFNFNFACWKPERTIAFVANKGAYYGTDVKPAVRKVPGIWFCGEKDTEIRIKNITERYQDGRTRGALWSLVMEPGTGHEVGKSKALGMVFLEDALAARLDSFDKLKPADPRAGWLGDMESKAVEKNTTSDAGPKSTSWFPGEATAQLWHQVVTGAAAPAAPESVPGTPE